MVGILKLKTGLYVESDDASETLPPGSAVKPCEATPSSQERQGFSAMLLRAVAARLSGQLRAFCSVLFGGTALQQHPTGSPLPVGNLPGALQTSVVTAVPQEPLPTGAKGQQVV